MPVQMLLEATAVITKNTEDQYVLKLTIIRERHSYAPPETHYASSYNLYDKTTGQLSEGIDHGQSVTWTRLTNDSHLGAKMVGKIQKRIARR